MLARFEILLVHQLMFAFRQSAEFRKSDLNCCGQVQQTGLPWNLYNRTDSSGGLWGSSATTQPTILAVSPRRSGQLSVRLL